MPLKEKWTQVNKSFNVCLVSASTEDSFRGASEPFQVLCGQLTLNQLLHDEIVRVSDAYVPPPYTILGVLGMKFEWEKVESQLSILKKNKLTTRLWFCIYICIKFEDGGRERIGGVGSVCVGSGASLKTWRQMSASAPPASDT